MKVLFIDGVHPVLSERLSMAGHVCEDASELEGELLLAQLHDAEGIVVRGRIVLDAGALDRAPKLRFIARAGAGLEKIDLAECERRGIRVLKYGVLSDHLDRRFPSDHHPVMVRLAFE